MKNLGYYGSVNLDEEDCILHGKIEFIQALVSYEGTRAEALIKAFYKAVDDYLATCHNQNIEPEKAFKDSLNVRLGI